MNPGKTVTSWLLSRSALTVTETAVPWYSDRLTSQRSTSVGNTDHFTGPLLGARDEDEDLLQHTVG